MTPPSSHSGRHDPARAMRAERKQPDDPREQEPGDRRPRDRRAPEVHVAPHPHGAWAVGLDHAQTDHREEHRHEREHQAERVDRREAGDLAIEQRGCPEQRRDGDHHDPVQGRRGREPPVDRAHRGRQARGVAEPPQHARRAREGRDRGEHQDQDGARGDRRAQPVAEARRHLVADRKRDACERRVQVAHGHLRRVPRRRPRAPRDRERGERDGRDHGVQHDRREHGRDHAAGERVGGLLDLAHHQRDDLEARERDHRERDRERDGIPGRNVAEVDRAGQRVRVERDGEAEHREQQLHADVDGRDDDRGPVEPGPADQPRDADRDGEPHRHELVVRLLQRGGVSDHRERVVRDEQQRQRDHDGEVEHHRPADDEPGEVAERVPRDGSRAAWLVDRAHALLVRGGRESEEQPGAEQHERRQPERPQRDDAEREVERARDLAVDDREDRLGTEDPLQSGKLACHQPATRPSGEGSTGAGSPPRRARRR